MGYLDLDMAYAEAAPLDAFTGHAAARGEIAEFSALEWTTILLARHDGLASLNEPGRSRRILGRLLGVKLKSRLADPRLEALRRFAVFGWQYGYNLPKSAVLAFRQAGFSLAQVETLLASVAIARNKRPG